MDNLTFTEKFRDLLFFACDQPIAEKLFESVRKASQSVDPDQINLEQLNQLYGGIPLNALMGVSGVGKSLSLRIAQRTFQHMRVPTTINGCSTPYGKELS